MMRRILSFLLVTLCLSSFIASSAYADEGASKLERTKALIEVNRSTQGAEGEEASSQPSGLKAARGLVITLGVFLIGVFLYQKFWKKTQKIITGGSSPVLTRLKVAPRAEVVLVDIDGKKFVVAMSEHGVALHPWGEKNA